MVSRKGRKILQGIFEMLTDLNVLYRMENGDRQLIYLILREIKKCWTIIINLHAWYKYSGFSISQGCINLFMEGHRSAEFSSNPN